MYVESKYKKAGVLFLIQLVALIATYVFMDVAIGTKFSAFDDSKKAMIIGNAVALLIMAVAMFLKCHWGVLVGTVILVVTHVLLLVKVIDIVKSPYMSWLETESKLVIYFTMAYLILVPLAYIIMSIALFANTSAQRMKGFASLAGLFVSLGSLPYVALFTKMAIKQKIDFGKYGDYFQKMTTRQLIMAAIFIFGTLCLIAGIATAAGAYIVKAKEYRRMNHQEDMYSQDAYNTDSNNTYGGSRYYNPASAHPQSTDTTQTAQTTQTTQTGPKFYTPFASESASTDEVAEQGYYNPNATADNNNFDPYAPIDK